MKKYFKPSLALIFITTFIGMVVYVNIYEKQDSNIFDEIYFEIDQAPLSKEVTRKDYSNFDDNFREYPVIQYTYKRNVQLEYENIFFEKNNRDGSLDISFSKKLDRDIDLKMWYIYNSKERVAEQELIIIDYKGDGEHYNYIDNPFKIKGYLDNYHVSYAQIDQYYEHVIKGIILKDWTKVYDSQFTTSDYDEIEVKKQWEDW